MQLLWNEYKKKKKPMHVHAKCTCAHRPALHTHRILLHIYRNDVSQAVRTLTKKTITRK